MARASAEPIQSQVREPGRIRLGILAIDGIMMSCASAPIDAFKIAQAVAEIRDGSKAPKFEAVMIGARGQTEVHTSTGLTISGLASPDRVFDYVMVPGIGIGQADDIGRRLASSGPEIELLRSLHLRGVKLAGTCTGTFLLAQTGLLTGRRATTSWWLATAFRRQFPDIELEASEMLVQDGDFYTTGAATAIFSLISHMVAQAGGNDLAQQVSRLMVMDADRQSQAPYISQALLDKPRHGMTEKAQKFLEKELHREISVGELAEICNVSERSLLRHFQAQHGMSPLGYMQHLRVERAKALLEASHFSFEEIVERCGYRDVPSFRKLFKRETSITPADYRERFRLRAR